jgi:hypothetical protein
MTTECLPCEMAATVGERRSDIGAVPEIDPGQSAKWSGPIGMENLRTGDGRLI